MSWCHLGGSSAPDPHLYPPVGALAEKGLEAWVRPWPMAPILLFLFLSWRVSGNTGGLCRELSHWAPCPAVLSSPSTPSQVQGSQRPLGIKAKSLLAAWSLQEVWPP